LLQAFEVVIIDRRFFVVFFILSDLAVYVHPIVFVSLRRRNGHLFCLFALLSRVV
jgi:hypothetical protein